LTKKRVLASATLGWVVLVAGCGGGGSDFPTGRYAATGPDGIGVVSFRPDGTWTFSFGNSMDDKAEASSGLYSTTDEALTFETDTYCKSQNPAAEQATYVWTLQGEQLSFDPVQERCAARKAAFDPYLYLRVAAGED